MDIHNMHLKDYILVFLKGILLGLISVGIPGVSASTIGIIIGIYFLMVDAISNILKDFKKNAPFLLILMLGYGLGSIGAAFSITILFEQFPLVTTFAILGFILASIPDMVIKLKKDFSKPICWVVFIGVLILLFIYNISFTTSNVQEFPDKPNLGYLIKMGIIGVVTSATFIIPGVDFAVIFLSLGIYYPFMNMITELCSFFDPNYFNLFKTNIQILLFYLAGYFIGVFLFSKLIKFLSVKYESQTQFASFAFIVAAPFIVIKSCVIDNDAFFISTGQIIAIVIACVICFATILSLRFIHNNRTKKDINNQ